MKVLSIQQPWAHLIVNGIDDKTIENRDWTTHYRGLLLIHAGHRFDENGLDWIVEHLSHGVTVPWSKSAYPRGGIVGVARLTDIVTESRNKWFRGEYGWCFSRAMPLPLIPMPGRLGLFDAPHEIVEQVRLLCARKRGEA